MPSPTSWTTDLISLILDFSFSLWDFRNGVLHGHTLEEQAAKERALLTNEITEAYETFHKYKFIVPSNFRYLFSSKTLQQRLHQDYDSLQCWLWSYREAVETQRTSTKWYAEQPRCFSFLVIRQNNQLLIITNLWEIPQRNNHLSHSHLSPQKMTTPLGVQHLQRPLLCADPLRVTPLCVHMFCLLPR